MGKNNITKDTNSLKETNTLLEKADRFLDKNDNIIFWIIFGLSLLCAIMLYDPRVSLTGDDSAYILRANNFVKHFAFPDFQGPLYPMALSIVVLFFGISLLPLKIFSLLSFMAFLYFTYVAFRKRIQATLLFSILLLCAINSHMLYYANQTFNEAFFLFIQSLFFLIFFRNFIDKDSETTPLVTNIKRHLWLALILLAAGLTRSIGFSLLIGVIGYFLFNKQWKNTGLCLCCFIIVFFAYTGLKTLIWDNGNLQFSEQGSGLLLKDYYHPELGKEDLNGFITRFFKNSEQYLSAQLFKIMGFQSAGNNAILAILIYALAIVGLFFTFRKNKYLFFSGIATGGFLVATFISLQVFWNQERLVITTYPFVLLICFAAIYYLLSGRKSLQILYFLPVVIILFKTLPETFSNINKAQSIKNEFSELTPDWVHYMKASQWAGKNLGKDETVACRKPTISTVYANGKDFYGIYNIPPGNALALLQKWEENPDKYIAINNNKYNPKIIQAIAQEYIARVEFGNDALVVMNSVDTVNQFLTFNNTQFVSLDQFKGLAQKSNNNFGVFYADSLLQQLKNSNVTHVMTACLRADPRANTGYTISTVERYAYFVQEKYPYIFQQVHQEGENNDEPAQIFKIRWEILERNK